MTEYVPGAWWDVFAEAGGLPDLETWLGGVDAESRVRIRQRVAECQYRSVLDCGAGLGLDYISFTNIGYPVQYQGLEPSEPMIRAAQRMAWAYGHEEEIPIEQGSIMAIPYPDESFEFVYCRHVLEHLPRFQEALHEMLRVAQLECCVVFFIRPAAQEYLLRERDGLWHNRYSKHDIDSFLLREPRVETFFWEHLNGGEVILHVFMDNAVAIDPEQVAARVKTTEDEPAEEPEDV